MEEVSRMKRVFVEKRHRGPVLAAVFVWSGIILMPATGPRRSEVPSGKPAAATAQASDLDVIVKFKAPFTKKQVRGVSVYGGRVYRELPIINSAACHISKAGLEKLLASGLVASYSFDRQVKASMDVTSQAVGANIANSYGWTGQGVGVAIIDSGIANPTHPDLTDPSGKSRVVYSAYARKDSTTDDLYGHGTHIAGMIGGRGTDSTGAKFTRTFKGVAPGANFINFAVLDRNGSAADSNVISAIQQAIALKSKYNIRVMNLSFGRPVYQSYKTDPLCQAVEQAWKAGIVVVVAAGNNGRDNSRGTQGYGTINSPANDPYVITVGAMRTMGTVSRAAGRPGPM